MTDRDLALRYRKAREAMLIPELVAVEDEIARRLDIDPVYLNNPRFRNEKIEAFAEEALAFDADSCVTKLVRFTGTASLVRPENPWRFVDKLATPGTYGRVIVSGLLPIDPPEGWVVVLVHDEGTLLCTVVRPSEIEMEVTA